MFQNNQIDALSQAQSPPADEAKSWSAHLDAWLSSLLADRGYSHGTTVQYRRCVGAFLGALEGRDEPPGEGDIRSWLGALRVQASTKNNYLAAVRSYFHYLVIHDHLDRNPAAKILPLRVRKAIKYSLTEEEVKQMLGLAKAADNGNAARDHALLWVLYATGLRVSEARNLNVADVNLAERRVHVRDGKGGKDRIVPFTPDCAVALGHWLTARARRYGSTDALFVSNWGQRLSVKRIQETLRDFGAKIDRDDLHPHMMRRTFCTHLWRKGMDLESLRKLMGHNSVTTTTRYIDASVKEIAVRYDEIF